MFCVLQTENLRGRKMSLVNKAKKNGVSLRITFLMMFIVVVAITSVLLIMSFYTLNSYNSLSETTDKYIELQDAAGSLMAASDYLTEEAQRYTVTGDRKHLDNYFTEAEVTRRREKAVEKIEKTMPDSQALKEIKEAMNDSVELMDNEYYAMTLMLNAQNDSNVPKQMRGLTLSKSEQDMTAAQQKDKAQELMHNEEYYKKKDQIRSHLDRCISELKDTTRGKQKSLGEETSRHLVLMIVFIVIQSLALILVLALTTRLGINPILRAVDRIKQNQNLPIVGANEFRYLASTYNVMYASYKKSIENLSYKASHDKLTGVYNRMGYDLIAQSVDFTTTAYLLFDADKFKEINDVHGHNTGDKIIQKIATTLMNNFRSDDFICRLGGDEFAVMMVHTNSDCRHLIEQKVNQINQALSDTSDGLPPISLSVGISFCSQAATAAEVAHEADVALYNVKKHGGGDCCFYSPDLKDEIKPTNKEKQD